MCIAILKTKKGTITDAELRNAFENNPDGAGIAYTINNDLYVVKPIWTAEELIKAVREAEKVCDSNMLIHCRIGTSGNDPNKNCHPFMVSNKVALIHNGILDINVPKDSVKNDTQIFIDRYLRGIDDYTLMHNDSIHRMIKDLIGSNNKFVLLNNKGYYKIINEEAGHWKNNCWFSNETYKYSYFGYRSKPYSYEYWEDDYEDNDLTRLIRSLDDSYLLRIGEEPIWCYETNEIISQEDYIKDVNDGVDFNYDYLDTVNEEAYELYLDKYYNALDKQEMLAEVEDF